MVKKMNALEMLLTLKGRYLGHCHFIKLKWWQRKEDTKVSVAARYTLKKVEH